ncbi:MAG: lipase family protein [Saccharospirillaceae bacterium]|nr:lipase family protein [Pseudomonadales bacterium]NRB80121.1 lipase family protein [Saccharospirillaceae bacterium]
MSLSFFDAQTKEFSVDHLNFFVQLSKTAYYDKDTMLGTLTEHKFDIPHKDIYIENNKTDTQCFVFSHQNNIFIIFRGSEQKLSDWKTNFKFHKTPWPGHEEKGKVHTGFYQAVESVWDDLQQKVNREIAFIQAKDKDAKAIIWVSGHSLGGSLAQVAFTKYLLGGLPKHVELANSYVYAAPRFASKKLAKYIDANFSQDIYRIVKQSDLIPRTPHRSAGYKNCFTLKFFNKKDLLVSAQDFSLLEKLSHRFSDVILFTRYFISIIPFINLISLKQIVKAHDIDDYARLCQTLREQINQK